MVLHSFLEEGELRRNPPLRRFACLLTIFDDLVTEIETISSRRRIRTASTKLLYIILRGFRGKREAVDVKDDGGSRQTGQGSRRVEQLGEQGYRSCGINDDVSIAEKTPIRMHCQ
jgi:hypothetical protein